MGFSFRFRSKNSYVKLCYVTMLLNLTRNDDLKAKACTLLEEKYRSTQQRCNDDAVRKKHHKQFVISLLCHQSTMLLFDTHKETEISPEILHQVVSWQTSSLDRPRFPGWPPLDRIVELEQIIGTEDRRTTCNRCSVECGLESISRIQ